MKLKTIHILVTLIFGSTYLVAQSVLVWDEPIEVATSSYKNDYPRIVLDASEEPMITWGGSQKVYFTKWDGSAFTEPLQMNDTETPAYVASWTGPDLVSRNDTVYAGFMHAEWGQKTYLVRSFNSGDSFSPPVLVENYPDSTSRFPAVAIDQNGHPLVAIMKMTSNAEHPHYVIRKSHDFGASFTTEANGSNLIGVQSEACDCCPAVLKSDGSNTVLMYRNNIDNIRDIFASVSTNSGDDFTEAFAIDNNDWQVLACPASGPDGVIIDDKFYTVFMSDGIVYLSIASLAGGWTNSIIPLGSADVTVTQNLPRIANYNKEVAIVWSENTGGSRLIINYTDDITSGQPFLQDTVYTSSFSSADVAVGSNGIHVAIEDIQSGSVLYVKGGLQISSGNINPQNAVRFFPNPVVDKLFLSGNHLFKSYNIYTASGVLVQQGQLDEVIAIRYLQKGMYILELQDGKGAYLRNRFLK